MGAAKLIAVVVYALSAHGGCSYLASRRAVLDAGASVLVAGRVEDLIAQQPSAAVLPTADSGGASAITESPLGVRVRRAVVRGAQSADGLDAQVCARRGSYATAMLLPSLFFTPPTTPTISLSLHTPTTTRSTQWDRFSLSARRLAGDKTLAPPPPATRAPPPPLGDGVAVGVLDAALGAATACALGGEGALRGARDGARAQYLAVWDEKAAARDAIGAARGVEATLARAPAGSRDAFSWRLYADFRAYNAAAGGGEAARRLARRFEAAWGDGLLAAPPLRDDAALARFRAAHANAGARGLVPLLEEGLPAASRALARAGFVAAAPALRADALDDADDRAELLAATRDGADARLWERLAESSRSASLTLAEPADLPAKLLLETQARRLGLGLLPGVAVAAVGALAREVGVPARIEEYYVDTVYRTAFEKDDYTDVQLELLFS